MALSGELLLLSARLARALVGGRSLSLAVFSLISRILSTKGGRWSIFFVAFFISRISVHAFTRNQIAHQGKHFEFDVSHSTFVLGYFLTHNNTRCSLQTRHFQSCNRRSRQIWQTSKAFHDLVRVYKDLAYKKRLPWLLQCHKK